MNSVCVCALVRMFYVAIVVRMCACVCRSFVFGHALRSLGFVDHAAAAHMERAALYVWDSMSQAIGSYEAPSAGMAPLEWMANAVSAGFDAIGMAMPAFIESTQAVVGWLMTIGSFPAVQMALLWLFLIGGGNWAFEKVKNYLVEPIKRLLNRPVDQAVEQVKQLDGPVSKDDAMKGIEPPADDMPGIGEPKTEAIAELRYLNEGAAGMLIKLISKIVGSVVRTAQLGFTGVGGTSGFVAGGMRGMSSGVIPRLIALVFDGLRLGANAGKFISGGIADLLGAPGKNLLDDEGNKVDPRVQRELMSIERAVNEFVSSEEYDKSQLSNSLQSKLINYFKKQ